MTIRDTRHNTLRRWILGATGAAALTAGMMGGLIAAEGPLDRQQSTAQRGQRSDDGSAGDVAGDNDTGGNDTGNGTGGAPGSELDPSGENQSGANGDNQSADAQSNDADGGVESDTTTPNGGENDEGAARPGGSPESSEPPGQDGDGGDWITPLPNRSIPTITIIDVPPPYRPPTVNGVVAQGCSMQNLDRVTNQFQTIRVNVMFEIQVHERTLTPRLGFVGPGTHEYSFEFDFPGNSMRGFRTHLDFGAQYMSRGIGQPGAWVDFGEMDIAC